MSRSVTVCAFCLFTYDCYLFSHGR